MANRLTDGAWEWPDHLDLLSRKLADVAAGRCKRLIVTLPPQNGKSSLVSHWFPVWFLNLFPDRRIVFVSYGAEYAESWGRRVRNSIAEHAANLSVRLSDDSASAGGWETTRGGGMVSVGIGGSVTGRRANLLVFDDPFKNAEEANSPAHRDKVWEFFQSAAYTRLTPDGAIVIIMTRWHEDDLVGRINKEEQKGGERWERLDLPAVAEEDDAMGRKPGEPLWPSRWPLETLKRIKRAVGTYFWNALYRQKPSTPEGNYFKRTWFKVVEADRVPRNLQKARSWDLAATEKTESNDPDWLAGCKMGLDKTTGKYYIQHVRREQLSPEGVENALVQQAGIDGRDVAVRVEREGAASGKIVAYYYTKLLNGYAARFVPVPRASKFTRSGPFNAACERGDVYVVAGDWNDAFLDELTAFPTGNHDDQVDAAVGAYEELTGGAQPWDAAKLEKKFAKFGKWRGGDAPEMSPGRPFAGMR
jgi:predicted phage terminase large subunit-like protein